MKKRILGLFLAFSMLAAASGISIPVYAAGVSEEIVKFSLEETDTEGNAKFESMLYTLKNGAYTVYTPPYTSATDNTYGIGRSMKTGTSGVVIKFDTPIDRAAEANKNKYLDIEYDFKINTETNPGIAANTAGSAGGGLAAVVPYTVDGTTTRNFSGLEFNRNGNIYNFFKRSNNFGTYETGEWNRCRLVMRLNNDGVVESTGNYTYYLNGVASEFVGDDYNLTSDKTAYTQVDGIRIYPSSVNISVDNIKITLRDADAAEVEKGALVKAIRDFESAFGDISDEAEAVELINKAKAVCESTSAADTDVTAAIADVEAARDIVYPEITTLVDLDFETADAQTAYGEAIAASSKDISYSWNNDTETYGIGTSLETGSGHLNYPIVPAINRSDSSSKNVYMELECDMMIITNNENAGKESLVSVEVVEKPDNSYSYKHIGGFEFYRYNDIADDESDDKKVLNSGYINPFWRHSVHIAKYDFNQWYRLKMVVLMNDNGELNNENVIDYYLNGEKVLTDKIYTSGVESAQYVRFYANNGAKFRVDNVTVKTFKKANPPVEKGGLITAMREFASTYTDYTEYEEAVALFAQAEEIYENAAATAEDVTAALGYIKQAETKMFPAVTLIKENFEKTPAYFFDSITAGDVQTSYTAESAQPESVEYADDTAYGTGKVMALTANSAEKSFAETALGADAKYITAEADVKLSGEASISLSDAASVTINSNSVTYTNGSAAGSYTYAGSANGWIRVRFDVNCADKTYNLYINGELAADNAALAESAAIGKLIVETAESVTIDNVYVYLFDNEADMVYDKGCLAAALRKAEVMAVSGELSETEAEALVNTIANVADVYAKPVVSKEAVIAAAVKVENAMANLSASIDGAKEIFIPGFGQDMENVIVQFNMHYGEQEGDVIYKELFFNGQSEKDFSDVKFLNSDGEQLQSVVESSGNYDFISDSNLSKQGGNYCLSDGTIVTVKDGYVQLSHDNAQSWVSTGFKGSTLELIDRNDNIYYAVRRQSDERDAGLHKLSADDGYTTDKLVIDCSDVVEQGTGITNDITWGGIAQDDDGYIYAGRYTEAWLGAALFVSDETGENFRIVDFRPDKQHVHTIRVNRNVYPNEVYVTYDDSTSQPLCHYTTNHAGYEQIKDNPLFAVPTAARSTGTSGTDDVKKRPANETAEAVLAHSLANFTQVNVPFADNDYIGYFGIIDKSDDKFYTAENGNKYTTKDNVYVMGYGEANILGGPGLYKTTDLNDWTKYKAVIENAQGSRNLIEAAPGVLMWGGLAGRMCHYPQVCLSYDDGETWYAAYTEGYNYSGGAGNGPFRMMSKPFTPKGTDEEQVLMAGWGTSPSMRAQFGGDNYFGYANVMIPKLPAEGLKIFVELDKEMAVPVTEYMYSTIGEETPAIKSTKNRAGIGDAVKFPVADEADGEKVYIFDVKAETEACVQADIITNDGMSSTSSVSLKFNTADGSITTADGSMVGTFEAVADGIFGVKLTYDAAGGKYGVYIDDTLIADDMTVSGTAATPVELALSTVDADGIEAPAVVYYSGVEYGTLDSLKPQFLVTAMTLEKDGVSTEEIEAGAVIKNIAIEKLDDEINGAVLFAALYDANNRLAGCKLVPVTGSGSYDVNLTVPSDGLSLKLILVKDTESIQPVYMQNCIE